VTKQIKLVVALKVIALIRAKRVKWPRILNKKQTKVLIVLKRVLLLASLLLPNVSTAGDLIKDQNFELEPLLTDSTLSISAELGALFTTGNTESTSVLGKVTTEYELEAWRHKYVFEFLYKEDQVTDSVTGDKFMDTTAERYLINAEAFYNITERDSVVAFLGSEHDRFGSYAHYTTLAAGYNVRLIEGSLIVFDMNIAPGYTFTEAQDGTTDDAPILRASGVVEWIINSNAKFIQNFSVETSEINTRAISESTLSAKIHGSMQMKVGYKITSNDTVEPGQENTDTEMSVTLVVNF
jgi:putative salt-induced outer membrane protein YdiY